MPQKTEWDFSRLKGKIIEKYGSIQNFASQLNGLSYTSLCYKINNKIDFRQTEVYRISILLGIEREDIEKYFFEEKVEKNSSLV